MFRDQVMEHYRVRGYTLHEGAKVRGRSGTVYRCDLVAEGPLGSLVVSFGDAGGFEGPELSAVKRTAHDIGAAPVVAAPRLPDPVLRAAREMGVIVLDAETVGAVEEEAPDAAVEPDHPWPDPDRPRRAVRTEHATPAVAVGTADGQSLWRHPRAGPAPEAGPDGDPAKPPVPAHAARASTASAPAPSRKEPSRRFTWLPGAQQDARAPSGAERPPAPRPPDLPRIEERPRRRVMEVEAPRSSAFPWQWVWGPVLYGAVTALVLFLFVVLFL